MRPPVRLLSDEALVRAARSGADEAVGEIARRHAPRLRRQCARIVGPDRADDAVQQALTSALIALRRADDERPIDLDRWLSRLAHNASIDVLRRGMPPWAQLDERIDGVARPPEVAARREEFRRAVEGLQKLPERQRRVLVASVFEGRSWAQIGDELEIGEPAVRQLLHRARTRMRTAGAAVVAPLWALRHSAPARAAGLLGGAGGAKVAGGAVAVIVAGAVALHAGAGRHAARAIASVAHPATTALPRTAAAPSLGAAVRSSAATARRAHRHVAARAPVAMSPLHPVAPAASGSPAPVTRQVPAATPTSRHTTAATPSPATTPSGAPTPGDTPQVATTPAAAPTAPSTPAPAPAPAAAAAPTPPPQPATTPAPQPAPAAVGHVTAWTPGSGYGGTLSIEPQGGGGATTAALGELTDLTCVHVQGGVVVSSAACTPSSLTVGALVGAAQSAPSPSSGQPTWTHVQLLLQ